MQPSLHHHRLTNTSLSFMQTEKGSDGELYANKAGLTHKGGVYIFENSTMQYHQWLFMGLADHGQIC